MPNLNEGLRPLDLEEMVIPFIEIDSYCSKMGEDRDVCVVSFQAKDRGPAKDLMEFIEKGYEFVLDADISSGENENGEYSIFVEIGRIAELPIQICDIVYGVKKLTGIEAFTFKYHKTPTIHKVGAEEIEKYVPCTPAEYDVAMHTVQTEEIKQFFNKTLMDDLTLKNDIITIHKAYGQKIQLKIIKEDTLEAILETAEGAITVDDTSAAETFWLSKVLGDYEINKIGNNLLFNNNGKAMLLQQVGL